jgi:hypothetical protein
MWIDQIVEFVAEKKLVAIKNVSLAEEHIHDYPASIEPDSSRARRKPWRRNGDGP